MITELEREKVIGLLERSRKLLVDTVAGAAEDELRWKMNPQKWAILEYVEHLAVAEDAILGFVRAALTEPARPETPEQRKAREDQIRAAMATPHKAQAPESMVPTGRFAGLEAALAAFHAARDRSVGFARTTQDDLRSHFRPHPTLGEFDAYQWLAGNGRHVETHSAHIKEIREAWRNRTAA